MRNECLESYCTQPNKMLGQKWTRLWKRYTANGVCWTIAIENNCIVKNFKTYREAKAMFDQMQRDFYKKKAGF